MKRIVLSLAVAVALVVPTVVPAQTSVGDLQSRIAELLQQITQLRQQVTQLMQQNESGLSTPSYTVPLPGGERGSDTASFRVCQVLERTLSRGARGEDVTALQQFLKERGVLTVEPTGYFGELTERALQRFQSEQNVVSSGSAATTGWGVFGPQTRRAVLARWCDNTGDGAPYARFSATPQRGTAPLVVTFNAWVGGFTPYRFMIDFGDGSTPEQISCPAPADACTGPGVVTHTYQNNGTYTATLYRVGNTAVDTVSSERVVLAKQNVFVGEGETIACTKEYRPVCARPSGCENTCPPGQYCTLLCKLPEPRTYGNSCEARAAGATVLHEGACTNDDTNPTQPFEPGRTCKAWYDGCNSCSRETPDGPAICTLRACIQNAPGYCTAYFDDSEVHTNQPPVINGVSGPTQLRVNETGTWSVRASDPEGGTLSYGVSWGDSYQSLGALLDRLTNTFMQTSTFEHTYARAGTYTIIITAKDSAGGVTRTTTTVQVSGDNVACTLEYAPVCGLKQVQCITTPCNPVEQTYSNTCVMKADGATLKHEGACTTAVEPVACTADAKLCPDGSWVGRTGPQCQFVCPTTTSAEMSLETFKTTPQCKQWTDGQWCGMTCTRTAPGGEYACAIPGCVAVDNIPAAQPARCTQYF